MKLSTKYEAKTDFLEVQGLKSLPPVHSFPESYLSMCPEWNERIKQERGSYGIQGTRNSRQEVNERDSQNDGEQKYQDNSH